MQGITLSFIHGFLGHPSDWDEVRESLGKSNAHLESKALKVEIATDWQSCLQQLADSIPDQSVLIGYSMGARLALGLALKYPQKCSGLIFASGNPGLESEIERNQRWEVDQRIASQLKQGLTPEFLEGWYQQSVFSGDSEPIKQEEMVRKTKHPRQNWDEILRTYSISQQPNYWPRLMELAMSALVLAGERDTKYRNIAERVEGLSASPRISHQIIPDCGHLVHRENPSRFAQIILEFLDGLS